MGQIIIAFSKNEDGKRIQEILSRYGFQNTVVCSTGAQALGMAGSGEADLVISGYRLSDMHFSQLNNYLPEHVLLLLVASERAISICPPGTMAVSSPVHVNQLINTIRLMIYSKGELDSKKSVKSGRPKERNEKEKREILEAKRLLIERNHLSEEEAHRYLQKHSMDTGRTMAETARMICLLLNGEE